MPLVIVELDSVFLHLDSQIHRVGRDYLVVVKARVVPHKGYNLLAVVGLLVFQKRAVELLLELVQTLEVRPRGLILGCPGYCLERELEVWN